MKTFIFIAGAPGSGKSTIANALQRRLNGPIFEFGWIPEFRNTGTRITEYEEDEALAYENLLLVLKNYAKHDFKNIIVTDLENYHIKDIATDFDEYDYQIFTLRIKDDEILKSRVLDESRSSGYRNWQEALKINDGISRRDEYKNEKFIDVDELTLEETIGKILFDLSD